MLRLQVSLIPDASAAVTDRDAFAPDHQTSQFLFHRLVLQGIDERVHTDVQVGHEHRGSHIGLQVRRQHHGSDVQVGHEHRGIVADEQVAHRLRCVVDDDEVNDSREPTDDKSHTDNNNRLSDLLYII